MSVEAETRLGSRQHLHPALIRGIGEVGPKQTHGDGGVKFGPVQYTVALVASAFTRSTVVVAQRKGLVARGRALIKCGIVAHWLALLPHSTRNL
eukprot:g41608.t1